MKNWFDQYCEEEDYMVMQGGWIEGRCYDIFLYAMQGLRQKWVPSEFTVSVRRTDLIIATTPDREPEDPKGFFRVKVRGGELEITVIAPRTEYRQMLIYAFNLSEPYPEIDWTFINGGLGRLSLK